MGGLKASYQKPALTIHQQISHMQSQGVVVSNLEQARHILTFVSYYRLQPYIYFSKQKLTKPLSFNESWQRYLFDRELRLLLLDVIERIEVAFRSALANGMGIAHGPHWYVKRELFSRETSYRNFMSKVDRVCTMRDQHDIRAYLNKYDQPGCPPIWILLESLSFNDCSKLYRNIKSVSDRKKVAQFFNLHPTLIDSWMSCLCYLRNLCAHHSRVWNRWFVRTPLAYKNNASNTVKQHSFHQQVIVIDRLMRVIAPQSSWKEKLYQLVEKHDHIPYDEMGFPADWKAAEFWPYAAISATS